MQIYVFFRGSLTADYLTKAIIQAYEYTRIETPDGTTFLRVIISIDHLDTRDILSFIREKLSSLDTYIVSIDPNIYVSNDYVKTQIHELTSRGETSNYLLMNIFKGYRAAKYCVFVSYI